MDWEGTSLEKKGVLWFLQKKMDTLSLELQMGVHSVHLALKHFPLSGHWMSYHCSLYLVEKWTFPELPLYKRCHRYFRSDHGSAGGGRFPINRSTHYYTEKKLLFMKKRIEHVT